MIPVAFRFKVEGNGQETQDIPADEEILRLRAEKGDGNLITPIDHPCGFNRESILKRFRELKEQKLLVGGKKNSPTKRQTVPIFDLPEGDIGFQKN